MLLRPRGGRTLASRSRLVKSPVLYALRHVSVSPTVTTSLYLVQGAHSLHTMTLLSRAQVKKGDCELAYLEADGVRFALVDHAGVHVVARVVSY